MLKQVQHDNQGFFYFFIPILFRDLGSGSGKLFFQNSFHCINNCLGIGIIFLLDMLSEAASAARQALASADAFAGTQALRSAAQASQAELHLDVSTASVMGVKVPHIEQKRVSRPILGRGYSIAGTSTTIDEAASAFEIQVDAIIKLAESELRLTRLAKEIQRTSRRLNALDHLLIPRLEAECKYIETTLSEHERSDHFRLKVVKRSLEHKRSCRLNKYTGTRQEV